MKKIWNLLFVSIMISLGFSSCSKETQWRDDNLAFFDNLKGKPGIKEIGDSLNGYPGIYYQVINEGTGAKPIVGNVIRVAYDVWLWNDTITYKSNLNEEDAFDSNDNYELTLGKTTVIDGWSILLPYMPVGSKWRVYIPYYLGYGTSATTYVPAYSTLIFDIELKKIVSNNPSD